MYEIRVFVSSFFAAFRTERNIVIFFVVHVRWPAYVQRKFEGVYFNNNHRNNLLFSYYKLGFRCFELNLFSLCFDLKDLNLNKPRRFERLRKLELSKKNTVSARPNLCCLSFQTKKQTSIHF